MHSLSLRASLVAVAKDKANVGGRGTRIEMVLLFCGHPGPKRREENPPFTRFMQIPRKVWLHYWADTFNGWGPVGGCCPHLNRVVLAILLIVLCQLQVEKLGT